jgi:hypothetical protein
MTNMKKVLITMTLLLTLTYGVNAASQKHRHTPQPTTVVVDTTAKDSVEAFSDTTTVAQTPSAPDDEDERISRGQLLSSIFDNMDSEDIMGMFFVLCVLLILFVLAPVAIIIALFYFINRNRKEKMRLAQMAVEHGQPIPDNLVNNDPVSKDDEYQKGMRQCFVGVGLMVFLGFAAGTVGFGIGALVFCIGLGKVFASRTNGRPYNRELDDDNRL